MRPTARTPSYARALTTRGSSTCSASTATRASMTPTPPSRSPSVVAVRAAPLPARWSLTARRVGSQILSAALALSSSKRWRSAPATSTSSARGSRCCARSRPTGRPPRGEWRIIEWPEGQDAPSDYWISNLPADTTPERLARLARLRWVIELDYRQLKGELGLDHYEGRSYPGFHHHCAIVTAAHGFLTLERFDPNHQRSP